MRQPCGAHSRTSPKRHILISRLQSERGYDDMLLIRRHNRRQYMMAITSAIEDSDGTSLQKILQGNLTTSQEEELNVIKDYMEGRPANLLPEDCLPKL